MPARILNDFADFNKGLMMDCHNPRQQFTPLLRGSSRGLTSEAK